MQARGTATRVHKQGQLQAQLAIARAITQRHPVHLGGSPLGSRREAAEGANPQFKTACRGQGHCTGHHCPQEKHWLCKVKSVNAPPQAINHAPGTHPLLFHPTIKKSMHLLFSKPVERVWHCPGRCRGRGIARHHNVAIWWLSHPSHTPSHPSPHHARTGALAEETQHAATNH